MAKRARILNRIIAAVMAVAFIVGGLYVLYTFYDRGSNFIERRLAEPALAAEETDNSGGFEITFRPSGQ